MLERTIVAPAPPILTVIPGLSPVIPGLYPVIPVLYPVIPVLYPVIPAKAGIQRVAAKPATRNQARIHRFADIV